MAFRAQTETLRDVFHKYGVREVLWSGTLMAQSGATLVAVAPLRLGRKETEETLLNGIVPYAVLYIPESLPLLEPKKSLSAGAYLLVFQREGAAWHTHIVDAKRETAATLTTREVAFEAGDKKEDPVQKAKRLLQNRGIDIKIVDIEIQFNGSTEVFVSFLFWRWSLFKDPPLPYLPRNLD